ncbi:translation initiation factor [Sulfurimonas sp. HSL-1716]|uniref:translation initiation factor n=1 Tax=Hydrocurvibacter sulfurireducens TaxID=3131937 RepID=UPI0031F7F423
MSRGKKLDLFIGAEIDEGWSEVTERRSTVAKEILAPEKHFLVLTKEKRRGKIVTLVGEFCLEDSAANDVVKTLKKKLACGGTYKEGWMEFQGEVQERLKSNLQELGFRFKK